MPKDPWTYKRRKKRQKGNKSIEDGQLPNSSELDIYIGSLSSEILPVPLNKVKKEIVYPDTRFQNSTALFPAIKENSEPIKSDPEEGDKGSEQKVEPIGGYRVLDPDDASISLEVMSEKHLLNHNPLKTGGTIYQDAKFQRATTLIPAQGIENIIPSEKPSETLKRNPKEDAFAMIPQKVKMSDLPVFDDCVIIGDPNSLEEIDLTDDSHRIVSQVITLE